MQTLSITTYFEQVLEVLGRSPLFHGLDRDSLEAVAERAELLRYAHDEALARQDAPSDAFLLLVEGGATVVLDGGESESLDGGPPLVLARISPPASIGEMGVLLQRPRSASVYADGGAIVLRFSAHEFHAMLLAHPYFGLVMCRTLAERLFAASRRIPLPELGDIVAEPSAEARGLLPVDFQIRHRVVPLDLAGDAVRIGCVDALDPEVLDRIRRQLPGLKVRLVAITADYFEATMRGAGGAGFESTPGRGELEALLDLGGSRLETVLRRMVAEGASELHLAAGQIARWRIDGALVPLTDSGPLGAEEVFDLVLGLVPRPALLAGFEDAHTFELTHEINDVARFRIRLNRDTRGVGATVRSIPLRVPTAPQLGVPPDLVALTGRPRGLILVSGPRGSGRSTTLAALVEHINRARPAHVVTLEDPVGYVHESDKAMVVQREIGQHADDLADALAAVRRDEPDVVVIGDLDEPGAPAALELASTGPLVLAGLPAENAVDAVERLLAMFDGDDRPAAARALSRCLLGVSAQVLVHRKGGGSVAVFEHLIADAAVSEALAAEQLDRLAAGRQTTLETRLAERAARGTIGPEDARRAAPDPTAFDDAAEP